MAKGGATFPVGASGPFVALRDICQSTQQFLQSELRFGQKSRTTGYTWGRVIRGSFSPNPVAG